MSLYRLVLSLYSLLNVSYCLLVSTLLTRVLCTITAYIRHQSAVKAPIIFTHLELFSSSLFTFLFVTMTLMSLFNSLLMPIIIKAALLTVFISVFTFSFYIISLFFLLITLTMISFLLYLQVILCPPFCRLGAGFAVIGETPLMRLLFTIDAQIWSGAFPLCHRAFQSRPRFLVFISLSFMLLKIVLIE